MSVNRNSAPAPQEINKLLTLKGKSETPNRLEAGFTLIEMVVVILIVAVAAALVFPRLPSTQGGDLKSSAKNLASGIRFLNDQAIITKSSYLLHVNITESTTRIAKLAAMGDEIAPDDQFMNRSLVESGITIEDVTTPDRGKVSEGELILRFGPGGNEQCITFHLKGGEQQMTVIAYPSGTKVKVRDGYQTLETEQETKS